MKSKNTEVYNSQQAIANHFPLYSEMAISEIMHFEKYSIFLRSDNIIQIQTKDYFEGQLDDGVIILNCIEKLSTGNKLPLLVIYGDFNSFSKELTSTIASHQLTLADALIIPDNWAVRMVGNLYISFNKPIRPTKFFHDVESALVWLKKFI